jgi:N-glycosylase/DNA lyase
MASSDEIILFASNYDLDATLGCGQAFGWERDAGGWTGVIRGRWARLTAVTEGIKVQLAEPSSDDGWLEDYLQTNVNIREIIATFPEDDEHLREAVRTCAGLRLVRQDPWECLASFILSSTKQIVQIRQIVRALCERHGCQVVVPHGESARFAFPAASKLAVLSEADLRACKMGFRAPYLLAAAQHVVAGEINLAAVGRMELSAAREELMKLDGVGEKIADCVLLFAYGFPKAFPVDVWVRRVLTQFYFRGRNVKPDRLRRFIEKHFGPNAGYAQQYLFHHVRLTSGKNVPGRPALIQSLA